MKVRARSDLFHFLLTTVEPIIRRTFSQMDRAAVQEEIAQLVERDPELFLRRYVADPRSLEGRYVNSDLMKETFPVYAQSPQARSYFNAVVHNAAAVLASEQFRRAIRNDSDPVRDTVIFLTGVPGAGKTTAVLSAGEAPSNVRVIYEGQLSNPEPALPKMAQALDAKLHVQIVAVHIQPERALLNTLRRFEAEGRGATLEAIASIQGRLPDGLQVIQRQFGQAAQFHLIDRRATLAIERRGWKHASELRSAGTYEHIREHLTRFLQREWEAGRISSAAYDQALGRAPERFHRSVAPESGGSFQRSEDPVSEGLVDEGEAKRRKRSGPESSNGPAFGFNPF